MPPPLPEEASHHVSEKRQRTLWRVCGRAFAPQSSLSVPRHPAAVVAASPTPT